MPLFSVTLQPQDSPKDHETEADSPEEAIERAERGSPSFKAESVSRFEDEREVEAWSVEGRCESCGKLLLQSLEKDAPEVYKLGGGEDETLHFCLSCYAELLEDQPVARALENGHDFSDVPEPMRAALIEQEPAFALEMADRYRAGDEATKADILAFFESDGPRKVHESKLKHQDGTPTSGDLEKAVGPEEDWPPKSGCVVCGGGPAATPASNGAWLCEACASSREEALAPGKYPIVLDGIAWAARRARGACVKKDVSAPVYRGPCLTKLRRFVGAAQHALCRVVVNEDKPGETDGKRALLLCEQACDELGGLPPMGVGAGDDGWGLTEKDLKGFPCPCSECVKPRPADAEAPEVEAFPPRSLADALASPSLPERTLRKVIFFRPSDRNRAEKALEALHDLSRWVAAGADFDLVLEKQNAKRPSTAPTLVESDPAYEARKLAEHWELLDSSRIDFFGVFGSEDDSPEPLAIFSGRERAEAWIEAMEADDENGRSDLVVMVIRDLRGRAFNHMDAPPLRESEASS